METQTLEGVATETENAPEMVKVLVEKREDVYKRQDVQCVQRARRCA